MSEAYFLSPHVHVCVTGKHVVLLDLERDKYLAVVPGHRLAPWVRGWPVLEPPEACGSGAAGSSADPGRRDSLLTQMIAQGMLVTDPRLGKEAIPVAIDRPEATLVEFDLDCPPKVRLSHLWHFVMAYTSAQSALKFRPIKAIVRAVAGRKTRASKALQATFDSGLGESREMATRQRPAGTQRMDMGGVRQLAAAFVHLRPLFFTAQEACLLDSLTLLNFLAAQAIFPDWVFGVKTAPFVAHCWVQHGDVVFNDNPDHVRGYTPILVV